MLSNDCIILNMESHKKNVSPLVVRPPLPLQLSGHRNFFLVFTVSKKGSLRVPNIDINIVFSCLGGVEYTTTGLRGLDQLPAEEAAWSTSSQGRSKFIK